MEFGQWLSRDLEELGRVTRAVDPGDATDLSEAILRSVRVFVVGFGRSGHVMRMFALRLMQLGLRTFVVGDATTPAIGAGDLLVVGSASGETGGALLAASQARSAGATVAAVVARPTSSLAAIAHHVLVIPGATPKAGVGAATTVLPLASVLEQAYLLITDCVVALLADLTDQTAEAMMARHANLE
jgi:6-phospho-3-hexuloisomerase